MARRRSTHEQLLALVSENGWTCIGPVEWAQARAALEPVSEATLRKVLRESGLTLDPRVEGVRQDSFDHLERTLRLLAREFSAADADGRATIRGLVIEAKDHARWALPRDDPARKAEREEMIRWMLTWLENPEVFPEWIALRKKTAGLTAARSSPPE